MIDMCWGGSGSGGRAGRPLTSRLAVSLPHSLGKKLNSKLLLIAVLLMIKTKVHINTHHLQSSVWVV